MRSLLSFFRRHYATHTRGVVAAALVTAAAAMAEASALVMIVPLAERATLGRGEVSGRIGPIELEMATGHLLLVVLGLIIASTLGKILALWLRARTVRSWELRERVRALRLLLNADYEYTARLSPAELQSVVGSHVSKAAQGLSIIGQVTNAALSFGILLAIAFSTAPLSAIVIAGVGGALLLALRPLAARTRSAGKLNSDQGIRASRLISEAARDGREIRLNGAQEHFLGAYRAAATEHATTQKRMQMIGGLASILYQGFGLLLVVSALAVAFSVSELDVTTLGAVALLFLRSLGYGQQLNIAQQSFAQTVPFVDRLDAELQGLDRAREDFGDDALHRVDVIGLRSVSYRYPGSDEAQAAISHVDLELRRPGTVALVGPSGSGKSTVAQLLLRLRHPVEGEVLVNGRDVRSFTRESWAGEVALVPQYPQLIRGSVRDNIAFFRPGVSDADIERVASAVGLDALFRSLPDGYETTLGDGGRELSGGQLQRIGIARALVGRPSLLILDEPTSALDAESEAWVQRAIEELSQHSLVVIISHRPSTVEACTRTVRLAEGRVIADEGLPLPVPEPR